MQVPDVRWQCVLKGRVCNNCALSVGWACCFLLGTHGLVHWTSPFKQIGAAMYRRAFAETGSKIVLGSKLTARHAAWVRAGHAFGTVRKHVNEYLTREWRRKVPFRTPWHESQVCCPPCGQPMVTFGGLLWPHHCVGFG